MNKYLLVYASLFLISCASSPESVWKENGKVCLRDAAVGTMIKRAEKMVDVAMAGENSPPMEVETKPLNKECFKRTFTRGTYQIVVFIPPTGETRNGQITIQKIKVMSIPAKECFERASKDLSAMGASFAATILDYHKRKYAWLWDDPDIGPVKWLDCTANKEGLYYSSLATMVHELNHEVSEHDCILTALAQTPVCFQFDKTLPLRGLAKIDKLPTKNPEDLKWLSSIQDLYMVNLNQPFLGLLDELNSYILTMQVYVLILNYAGPLSLMDPESQKRTPALLPLFQLYTARYLYRLKNEYPKQYAEMMKNSLTKTTLQQLFVLSETTYREWLRALEKTHQTSYDYEAASWDEYLRLRKLIL